MKYFAVGEIDVTDPAWVEEYIGEVTSMVARFGGRYLARTENAERLEGDRSLPHVFVIIEWPDRESAARFYESVEYAPFLEKRLLGSKGQFVLVPGEDLARPASEPDAASA